jgi:hypothetical protein
MTYSQRDVPGMTRGAIPLLAKHGVKAVTIGETDAASPLDLPPILLWKDRQSGQEVMGLFHPHGYGNAEETATAAAAARTAGNATAAAIVGATSATAGDTGGDWDGEGIRFDPTGSRRIGISTDGDCVLVDAAKTALCYAWRGDNQVAHMT